MDSQIYLFPFLTTFFLLQTTTVNSDLTWWNPSENPDPNPPVSPQFPITDPNNSTYLIYNRESFPSPSGGIIYRNRVEARRQSRNPSSPSRNYKIRYQPHLQQGGGDLIDGNGILVGDICDPEDPVYSKCTLYANCIASENNLSRCNCTDGYDVTSEKKCKKSWGQYCTNKESCNYEAGLVCIDNRCECDNSDVYQLPSKTCRSKVGGSCNPPSTELGIRFSRSSTSCVKNAICKSFGPSGLSFRCVCRPGYVESRFGYCSAGVGMACQGKGECDGNVPLVCKQGTCACRDSLHVYDPGTNTCVGLAGAQCCTDPEGLRCISSVRTGCVEGAFCKENSLNLPGRCVCLPFNVETEERLCKANPNLRRK